MKGISRQVCIVILCGSLAASSGVTWGYLTDDYYPPDRDDFYSSGGTTQEDKFLNNSGDTIGQTFTAVESFDTVGVFWRVSTGTIQPACTITVYGPVPSAASTVVEFKAAGLIASYSPAQWRDWVNFPVFFEAQPPGRYYMELSNPVSPGSCGVVAHRDSRDSGGDAYINGVGDPDLDLAGHYGRATGFHETSLTPAAQGWGPSGVRGSLGQSVTFVPTDAVSDTYEISRSGNLGPIDLERYWGMTPTGSHQSQVGMTWQIPMSGSCDVLVITDRHRVLSADSEITCKVSPDNSTWYTLYQDDTPGALTVRMSTTEALAGSSTVYLSYTIAAHDGTLQADTATISEVTVAQYSQTDNPGDVLLWGAHPLVRLYPEPWRYYDEVFAVDPTIEVAAARNEWESFQLVVSAAPEHDLTDLSVEFTDLNRVGGGGTVPAANLRWYKVCDVVHYQGRNPDVLADPCQFQAAANVQPQNYPLWVALFVPKGTSEGQYVGTISLKSGVSTLASQALSLTVWDFTIPTRNHCRMGLFNHTGSILDGGDYWFDLPIPDEDYHQYMEQLYIDHRLSPGEHSHSRVDNPMQIESSQGAGRPVGIYTAPETIRWTMDRFRLWAENGLDFNNISIWSWYEMYATFWSGIMDLDELEQYFTTYGKVLAAGNWLDGGYCYTRLKDEMGWPSEAAQAQAWASHIRSWAPGLKILNTASPLDVMELTVGACDIWSALPFLYLNSGYNAFYQERLAAGEEVWMYIHYRLFQQTDPVSIRQFFWTLADEGLHGSVLWSTARGSVNNKQPGPWWDLRMVPTLGPWPGDGTLWYADPDAQRHWPSVRVQHMRDGLEDFEYWYMLKDYLETGDPCLPIYAETQALRDSVHSWPMRYTPGVYDERHDPNVILGGRAQLADVLSRVPKYYKLDVEIHGFGDIDVDPNRSGYLPNDVVTVTAAPDEGASFEGWGVDADGVDNPLQIVMDSDKTVLAFFSYGFCGMQGFLKADFNRDCQVDLVDFATYATYWLQCSDPEVVECDPFWR